MMKEGSAVPRQTDAADADSVLQFGAGHSAALIATRLRRMIEEGDYRRGEPLPPERNLAEAFGVSRGTIRKALARIEEAGLVIRRVGSGTFVARDSANSGADVAETTSPLELMEARFGVERHMVQLAVVNANRRDLDQLGQALERIEETGNDPEQFTYWDERFHLQLAECTHNPLFVSFYKQINDVRAHDQWRGSRDKILTPVAIAEYNRHHRALYEALNSRDTEAALRLISEHLEKARLDLLGTTGK